MPTTDEILAAAERHGLSLRPETAVPSHNGWDFAVVEVVATDGTPWILRAPRREELVEKAQIEHRLLTLLRKRLTIPVPDWQVVTPELIAYPRLAGDPAYTWDPINQTITWRIDRTNLTDGYVKRLGQFLAELHATPVDEAGTTGIPVRSREDARWKFDYLLKHGATDLNLHPDWVARAKRWLDRDDAWAEKTVVTHNDLHIGHTLVDKEGSLAGVIDWTDARVTDPVHDFKHLHKRLGPAVTERLLAAYQEHGGRVWPALRYHITEAAAFLPLESGLGGLEFGYQDAVDLAREYFAVPPQES